MNEFEFEKLISESTDALRRKQAALEERFGLGTYARWHHDGEAGTLTFSNDDGADIVEARTTEIGTYSLNSRTWMWAWANNSVTDAQRAKSARLKGLFDVTGMRLFHEAHFDADEFLAWELAALGVHHLNSLGCYRGPVRHLWVFLSIDDVAMRRAT